MKKTLLLSAVALCTALAASAQISKGSSYLGGNAGFRMSTTRPDNGDKTTLTLFNLSPSMGFAYKENRVWGLLLSYGNSTSKTGNDKYSSNSYGIGAFLRQYQPLGKGCYLFAQESLVFYYNNGKSNSANSSKDNTYNTGLSLSPGFAYDISKKFQLELLLNGLLYANYGHNKVEQSGGVIREASNLSAGSSLSNLSQVNAINIGARFAFGR
ncbi:hypothetical protein HNQ91_004542 [Filimonas zeae]|uniref:outer membrane beta-barrel protein n=1 Tax=Filimonas zeae TaxID=1737353 RepID=UPI00166B3DF1|nr:outer membrane beta-barrel protein [Filimonas zeae]MDR6341469.1 hypothetical protein [Filimonas zeae]